MCHPGRALNQVGRRVNEQHQAHGVRVTASQKELSQFVGRVRKAEQQATTQTHAALLSAQQTQKPVPVFCMADEIVVCI